LETEATLSFFMETHEEIQSRKTKEQGLEKEVS